MFHSLTSGVSVIKLYHAWELQVVCSGSGCRTLVFIQPALYGNSLAGETFSPPPSGAVPRQDNTHKRQPRVPANHAGVRFLWWVPPKVWLHHRVEVLHRDLWLPLPLSNYRWQDILRARRPLPKHPDLRPDSHDRQEAGGATWWPYVWPAVVGPRR